MKVTYERREAMKFINLPTGANGYEDALKEVINLRVRANEKKAQAKTMEEEANTIFQGLAEFGKFDSVETNLGTIKIVNKETNTLDKEKCKDFLIRGGVDSDLVASAFTKALRKSESSYVGFFPPRGEQS
jgi:hypothetical protein